MKPGRTPRVRKIICNILGYYKQFPNTLCKEAANALGLPLTTLHGYRSYLVRAGKLRSLYGTPKLVRLQSRHRVRWHKNNRAKGKKLAANARKSIDLQQQSIDCSSRNKRLWNLGVFKHKHGRGKHGYRKDLGHNCRSEWEANYARYLKYKGIKYQYEPKRFHLKALDSTYLPDFLLEDGTYVEVKGWDESSARAKRKAFRKQYGHRLVVIGPKRYKRLMGAKYQDKLWKNKKGK